MVEGTAVVVLDDEESDEAGGVYELRTNKTDDDNDADGEPAVVYEYVEGVRREGRTMSRDDDGCGGDDVEPPLLSSVGSD